MDDDSTPTHSLVIGGTRGIGRAVVRTLAQDDRVVSVIGRRPPSEADRGISAARYWAVDLTDDDGISAALGEITRLRGPLSNLVFLQRYRGEGDPWKGEIETSLSATKSVIDALVDQFDPDRQSSIVIVGSIGGHFVAEDQPLSYHVAKAGLNHMVAYYAYALGPRGIRVNAVSPSAVMKEESRDYYERNTRLLKMYEKIVPLGRIGTSEDIANVIAFLCSPKASFITGQNIVVDGGVSLQSQESLARKLLM